MLTPAGEAFHQGVELKIHRRCDPSWTAPDHEIVRLLADNCTAVLGAVPAKNMRCGASDARLYRRAGIPSVVCGLAPHNMGCADEYVDIDELVALGKILALTAFDYLGGQTEDMPSGPAS
jgi:succinyl-diaminopimelate desuccinylase